MNGEIESSIRSNTYEEEGMSYDHRRGLHRIHRHHPEPYPARSRSSHAGKQDEGKPIRRDSSEFIGPHSSFNGGVIRS